MSQKTHYQRASGWLTFVMTSFASFLLLPIIHRASEAWFYSYVAMNYGGIFSYYAVEIWWVFCASTLFASLYMIFTLLLKWLGSLIGRLMLPRY